MPESLKKEEVQKGQDPTVAKQWDEETSTEDKYKDFGAIADGTKMCMMGTFRPGTGPVGRSMAIAKRVGTDFLFLSNGNSKKFEDIKGSNTVALSFQNTSNADWISVTGEVVTATHDDPRIKDLATGTITAWFGDLGDGVHTGKADDPRMYLIEVKATYISYWKHTTTGLPGLLTEAVSAAATGSVAKTGALRQLTGSEIEKIRSLNK